MRRPDANTLSLLNDLPPVVGAPASSLLTLRLPLRTIPPMIGGGARARDPDPRDPVRVPSIRGHLRWWFRALSPRGLSPEALFADERAIFGGVTGETPTPSRLVVRVCDVPDSSPKPAGWHKRKMQGHGYEAAATWTAAGCSESGIGYGLFPLQRSKDEATRWPTPDPIHGVPTRNIIPEITFKLDLRLRSSEGQPDAALVERLINAVWCWVHLGGIGARTRRGFGALALDGAVTTSGRLGESARVRFATTDRSTWLKTFQVIFGDAGNLRPLRRSCRFLLERSAFNGNNRDERSYAHVAHATALGDLARFRQGAKVGRAKKFGATNWPDAYTLRALRDPTALGVGGDTITRVTAGTQGIPRAAFGMPLNVKFKDAPFSMADASVTPAAGGARFASPLLLRPAKAGGQVWAIALALDGEHVSDVSVTWEDHTAPSSAQVERSAGASHPIAGYLTGQRGDAILAWRDWALKQGWTTRP